MGTRRDFASTGHSNARRRSRAPLLHLALIVGSVSVCACGDETIGSGARDVGPLMDVAVDTGADVGMDVSMDASPMDALPDPDRCNTPAGTDNDMDGFVSQFDCNDCSAQVNPGAFDEPGNGIDEDCDGVDATVMECDRTLALGSVEPLDAARAMGLCKMATGDSWGVISARYTSADGTGVPRSNMQFGILPSLGVVSPVDGGAMLALSSGVARSPSQAGFTSECDYFGLGPEGGEENYPPGFPVASAACGDVVAGTVYNSVALEVTLTVPTNAFGFRFNSNFFTYEYPEFICDEFNDFFAVLRRENAGTLENIVFDDRGEPVSVNNSLFSVCTPGFFGGRNFECPRGRSELSATGFDSTAACGRLDEFGDPVTDATVGGATGWLTTTAPVTGGSQMTLRFTIWDSGDPDLDSLSLIDGFEWELDDVVNERPQTAPLE